MTLSFHPAVQAHFIQAIAYYESMAGGYVADRCEAEIRLAIAAIASTPRRFPFYGASRVFRRARAQLINSNRGGWFGVVSGAR